jgi:hypothetical protein
MFPETTRPVGSTPESVEVELLAIDLATCTRCTGTLANIERAIEQVRQVAASIGTTLRLRKTLITSEAEARAHWFWSSPTIRIDGRDLTFDTRESRCDSCSELCGCDQGTSCRVWSYRGEEHTEAPVGLIVEALLAELAGGGRPGHPTVPAGDFTVPENLRRFFAARASQRAAAIAGASPCCPADQQETCCEPVAKTSCCAPAVAACGCA